MHGLIEPPKICIKAGYYMTKARLKFVEADNYYLNDAIEHVKRARAYLEKNHGVFQMRVSPVLVLLYEAQHVQIQYREATGRSVPYSILNAAAEKVGSAHYQASLIMQELGFRPITVEDFKEFGAGGGR